MDSIGPASTGISGPAGDLIPITPNDGADVPILRALYIEGAGSLRVTTAKGELRNLTVPAFFLLPVGVTRVHATGTTATGIHGVPL